MEPLLTLAAKVIDFPVEGSNHVRGTIDGSSKLVALALPARDPFDLCSSSSLFRIDLVAQLAFLAEGNGLHDEFHAARLSGSVLSVAVLSEVAPLPIAACESMLIEEAHVSSCPWCRTKLAMATARTGRDILLLHVSCRTNFYSVELSESYYQCVRGVDTLPTCINLLIFRCPRPWPMIALGVLRVRDVGYDVRRHYLIEEDMSASGDFEQMKDWRMKKEDETEGIKTIFILQELAPGTLSGSQSGEDQYQQQQQQYHQRHSSR